MEKKDVIDFFDRLAPGWDASTIRSDPVIGQILDGAEISEGKTVLDVACGTGVLFPDYLDRKVAHVTGVDISPEMARIAASKYPGNNITVVCADVEQLDTPEQYDCIMVYNAFPHFPDPENLIRTLCRFLKPGGTLTVAHGMSRAQIDRHHEGPASKVSVGLMHEDRLAQIMGAHLQIAVKRSDDQMYQVTGKKL